MSTKKRIIYMDLLTCLAALFVVYLHCTLTVFTFRVDKNWFESMFIQSFFIWPVPIFFMISGANLLKYRERYDTKTFFIKRFKRVAIPFLVWSLIWLIYDYLNGAIPNISFKLVAKLFVYNQIQNIFWFFYAIIGIYICTPILSLICKKENKKTVLYFIGLCLVQIGIIPMLSHLTNHPIPFYNYITLSSSYVIYYLMGWYLHNFPLTKAKRIVCYFGGILSGIIIFFGSYILNLHNSVPFNRVLFYYDSPLVFLLSIAIFIFFQHINWEPLFKTKRLKWLTLLSSASFGVYIVHKFFIFELTQLFKIDQTSTFFMLAFPLIVYALSVILIVVLKKMPIVKHIIP